MNLQIPLCPPFSKGEKRRKYQQGEEGRKAASPDRKTLGFNPLLCKRRVGEDLGMFLENPPPFGLRLLAVLVGCACWLRSPAPPKVQPMRPAWAFAALALTPLRLKVRGCMNTAQSLLCIPVQGCHPWQPAHCIAMRPWQPARCFAALSHFTVPLRAKVQGDRPWSPVRRCAAHPPFPKEGAMKFNDNLDEFTLKATVSGAGR